MPRVGIDIGGTFTDTVLWDEETGHLIVGKVLTTPRDPSEGVITGLEEIFKELGIGPSKIKHIIHGTTLAANAIIERKGARTAFITTKGFRDYLETGREKLYDLYDIYVEMPEPLVPRYLRRGITERLDETGRVVAPLSRNEAEATAAELAEEKVESVGICFLHSFRNPVHEREMKEIITRSCPGVYVSLSVEVVPEMREYERGATTVANAYIQPLIDRYLDGMEQKLKGLGFGGELHIMLSNGGITTCETSRRFPVRVVESGPAAGAIAASFYGELLGAHRLISFDMGGTTAKICFIEGGRPMTTKEFEVARVHRFKKGSGWPIKLPVVDIIEIGAGGGSIARADKLGLLKVGPQSSEADPGPVCYGKGGLEPTVTDADLVLGYLDPLYFLGGKMKLDGEKARQAIEEKVAKPLGITLVEAAWGIHNVVNGNMVNAARVHASEKGKDPRSYDLMAFGGAGPVHALPVAKSLGVKKVVVPLGCGATSALGLLTAPFTFDFVRTHMGLLKELDFSRVNELLREMEEEGRSILTRAGIPKEESILGRTCDMRYAGQRHEIPVPIPPGPLESSHIPAIKQAFDAAYKQLYHRLNEGYEVECLNWRVVASGPKPKVKLKTFLARKGTFLKQAIKGTRPVYIPEIGDYQACTVYDHYRLFPGAEFTGPSIIEQRESTVVVGSGNRVCVDECLNLIISL